MKYEYQELPHSKDTTSPHSQKTREEESASQNRHHKQKWQPEGLPPCNGQRQNNLPRGFKPGSKMHKPNMSKEITNINRL